MTAGIVEKFKSAGLHWQNPEAVAQIILGLICEENMVGKGIYLEGGDDWEVEDSLYETQPLWLSEDAKRMRTNAEAVNKGALMKN